MTLTRNQFFGAGFALVAGATALGLEPATALAQPPAGATGAIPAGDLAYVRLLIGVELLAADFYTEAIASKHLRGRGNEDAVTALVNETEHYDYLGFLVKSGGGVPLTAADVNFSYPTGAFYTAKSVLALATTLEALSLGAYLGAPGNVLNPVVQAAIAQITATEAQHLSAFSLRSGGTAFQAAFPQAMTIEEASDALGAYTS
jgi:hypothetical protein